MSIHRLLARMVLAVCLALGATLANAQAQTNAPEALLKRLVEAGQAEKTDLLKALSETGDERARGWLEAVRDGKLAMIEDTGALVIVVNNRGRNWQIADALTGEDLGEMSRRDLQNLRVNNALRADIEGILSVIDLTVADPGQRALALVPFEQPARVGGAQVGGVVHHAGLFDVGSRPRRGERGDDPGG